MFSYCVGRSEVSIELALIQWKLNVWPERVLATADDVVVFLGRPALLTPYNNIVYVVQYESK